MFTTLFSGDVAHHGTTLDMRGLILDNVIFAVHGVRLVELDSHGFAIFIWISAA